MQALSSVQKAQLESEGYTIFPKIFSKRAQESLLGLIRAYILVQVEMHGLADRIGRPPHDTSTFFNEYLIALAEQDYEPIRTVYGSFFSTTPFRAFAFNPKLLRICADLLGCKTEHVFVNNDRLRIDLPGLLPYRLGWHQESSYASGTCPFLQVWSPLIEPSSFKNGGIEIAPRSHLRGHIDILPSPDDLSGPGSQQILVSDQVVAQYETQIIEIDPGDVVLFSKFLIHRSADPARQTRVRYSIILRCSNILDQGFRSYPVSN